MKHASLLLFFIFLLSGYGFAQDSDDIVNWNEVTLILPLVQKNQNGKKIDKLTLNLGGVLRIGRNLKRLIDKRVSLGLSYQFNQNLTVGTTYLYRWARPTESPRQFEHRLYFFVTAEKRWKTFSLRNRFMTMYQIRHSRPDSVVQRNRLQFTVPIRKDDKVLFSPFIADEVYYDYQTKKLFRNDLFIGITKQMSKHLSADFFFLKQNISVGAIRETAGFGLSLRYKIR